MSWYRYAVIFSVDDLNYKVVECVLCLIVTVATNSVSVCVYRRYQNGLSHGVMMQTNLIPLLETSPGMNSPITVIVALIDGVCLC